MNITMLLLSLCTKYKVCLFFSLFYLNFKPKVRMELLSNSRHRRFYYAFQTSDCGFVYFNAASLFECN